MSQIKVDSISNRSDIGPVELTNGATLPSGSRLNVRGNVNLTGISTVGFLTANNANVSEIVTATSFYGDGSQLQGLQVASDSKSIALKTILDPLPFRA